MKGAICMKLFNKDNIFKRLTKDLISREPDECTLSTPQIVYVRVKAMNVDPQRTPWIGTFGVVVPDISIKETTKARDFVANYIRRKNMDNKHYFWDSVDVKIINVMVLNPIGEVDKETRRCANNMLATA